MPMNVTWDDPEKTIIRADILPPMTWQMYDDGVDEIVRLAKSVPYRVDIINHAGTTPMPPGSPLPHLKRAFRLLPSNVGMLISSINNVFARTMTSVVGRAYFGPRFKVVETVEIGWDIIYKERAKSEADATTTK